MGTKTKLFIVFVILCLTNMGFLIYQMLTNNDNAKSKNNNSLAYADYNQIEKQSNFDTNKLKEIATTMTVNYVTIAKQLDKSLKGKLAGKGYLFAAYALKYNIDPYLAAAITLQETGCNYSCSTLVNTKNNVGGMRGSGSYLSFASIDEGIKAFLDNLYYNYYKYGLDTAEKMNSKYAESNTWAQKVNVYVNQIKTR